MNKCERAQEAINNLVQSLDKQYQIFKKAVEEGDSSVFVKGTSFSLEVRKNLMAFRSCVARYSVHVDAIKKDCPVEGMPRVTYLEERLGIAVTPKEADEVIY